MPLVKIIKDYDNAEGWVEGDVVDITDPEQLIKEGKVVLLDESGEETEKEGEIKCPTCLRTDFKTALELADHIYEAHPYKSGRPTPGREGKKPARHLEKLVDDEVTKLTREEALKMIEDNLVEGKEDELAGVVLGQFNPLDAMSRKEQIRRQRIKSVVKGKKIAKAKKEARKRALKKIRGAEND
jgi:uncharacterized C2H2 Zn-finger protein